MPIIHFINNKTQTAGGMKNVLNYVSRKEKTVSEDKRFVTGVNCSPETALDEMTATKNLYHKTDGRLYYHLVQSFPSGYEIEPELAHKIAVELAEKATADLSSQAGKLNEEYGSKLKELDEYKHKLRLKVAKWIVISQSVLIALSAALQLWLR